MQLRVNQIQDGQVDLFREVVALFHRVFEMKDTTFPPEAHLAGLLQRDDFLVFAAIHEELGVIGGLTAYVLHQYYNEKPLAYIYDLAVDGSIQRRGVGKTLIKVFKEHCSEAGFEEVFVQADRVDQHAVDFYRKTRPTEEEDVLHFYYTL